jgi:hypothetical protein
MGTLEAAVLEDKSHRTPRIKQITPEETVIK